MGPKDRGRRKNNINSLSDPNRSRTVVSTSLHKLDPSFRPLAALLQKRNYGGGLMMMMISAFLGICALRIPILIWTIIFYLWRTISYIPHGRPTNDFFL